MSVTSGRSDISGLQVLIVDDEPMVVQTVRDMLRDLGVRAICSARDGAAALDVLEQNDQAVNVVVADWNMPRMTGVELCEHLRSSRPDLAFILLTGRADAESVLEARRRGVDGYLRKPFSAEQLRAKLVSAGQRLQSRGASTAA